MGQFSVAHLLILAFILLLIFGPSRLPDLGKSIGKAIKGFKDGMNEIDAESRDVSNQSQAQIKVNEDSIKKATVEDKSENKG